MKISKANQAEDFFYLSVHSWRLAKRLASLF